MVEIAAQLQAIEQEVGRLSPVQKILLGTEGSVTHLLEVVTGSRVTIVTKVQQVVAADREVAAFLNIGEGEPVNYRVVEIRNEETGEPLIYATSNTPLSRLSDEFRDDLMKADIPIGRIIQRHGIETRREILAARTEIPDPEVRNSFHMFRHEPLLSREYRIIHKGNPLIRIKEQFPYHHFLDERRVLIEAPSRIHLGLIDMHSGIGRVDGGIGIALDSPGTLLEAKTGPMLEVTGGDSGSRGIVQKVAENVLSEIHAGGKARFTLRSVCPRHAGLGSGTQLALATARAICELYGRNIPSRTLALMTGRGGTSGIGTAAFESGGFIVDGGHLFGPRGVKQSFSPSRASAGVPAAPVIVRHECPEDWKILLAIPYLPPGANGIRELDIFRNCCPVPLEDVREICHEVLMRMIPGIIEHDLDSFARSVNRLRDLGFKKVELSFRDPSAGGLMDEMIAAGAPCAGMSSFGPALYAIADTDLTAIEQAARKYMAERGGGITCLTSARNSGARIRTVGEA